MGTTKENYSKYAKVFIEDGMVPLTYEQWVAIKAPHHEERAD